MDGHEAFRGSLIAIETDPLIGHVLVGHGRRILAASHAKGGLGKDRRGQEKRQRRGNTRKKNLTHDDHPDYQRRIPFILQWHRLLVKR